MPGLESCAYNCCVLVFNRHNAKSFYCNDGNQSRIQGAMQLVQTVNFFAALLLEPDGNGGPRNQTYKSAGVSTNNVPDRLPETCSGDQSYAEYFARPKRFACPDRSGDGSNADFGHEDNAKQARAQ